MSIESYVSPILHTLKAAHECKPPEGYGKGREARNYEQRPFGTLVGSTKITLPRLSRKDLLELIKEKDAKKAWVTDICDRIGSKVKNQQQTNYCWINAVIRVMECRRAAMGLPYVELSPASVGALIKNFRNVGGWGGEGLEFATEHGVSPAEFWPCNAINPKYDNEESRKARKRFVVDTFAEVEPGDYEMSDTLVACDIPTAWGIPAWSHEIAVTRLAANAGKIVRIIDNSWGEDWGTNGRGTLTGRYDNFDDCCAPITFGAADR